MIAALAFYAFAFVLVASAVMVVTARNPVHSVLFLILAFFNASALFLLIGAEFLAMILVIVYVGAVAVLFLFVVMMLDIDFARLREGFQRYAPVGAVIGGILFLELVLVAAGLILLVAMIGAIVLTHRERVGTRRQVIADQVGRTGSVVLQNVAIGAGVSPGSILRPPPKDAPKAVEHHDTHGGHH